VTTRREPETVIVKVQIPLFPPGSKTAMLYDKHKKHRQLRYLSPRETELLGDAAKGFFYARWSHAGGWDLLDRAPDEPW
jgi:hypothetical protein